MKLFKSKKKIEAQKNQQDVEYVSSKLVLVARDFGFSLKDLKVKECGVIPSLRDDSYVFFGLYNKDKTKIKDVVSGKVYACVDGVIQDGDKKYNEYSLNYFKAERAERPNFCMYSYYLKPKKNVCVKTTIFGTMEKYETFYLESIPDVSPNELFGEENVVVTKQTLKEISNAINEKANEKLSEFEDAYQKYLSSEEYKQKIEQRMEQEREF